MPSLENKIVTHITLSADASTHNRPPYVYAKQYDANSRYLIVRIVDSNKDINVKSASQLNATKPDGTHAYISGTANADGTVTFGLTNNLLAAEGKIDCDITVFDSTSESQSMFTTSTFFILVDESNYNADAIESTDEPLTVPGTFLHNFYVGSNQPPDEAIIWIDPNSEETPTERWEFEMEDGTMVAKTVVVTESEEL